MKKIILIISLFLISLFTSSQKQWHQLSPGIDVGIYDVFCVDAYNVYCTGYYGPLIKTTDGGESWQIINDMNFSSGLYFINQDTGYVGGTYGNINRTEDGGNTWITQNIDTISYYWNDYEIKMISSDTIFVTARVGYESCNLYRSFNGGQSWEIIKQSALFAMFFLDNGCGFTMELNWDEIKTSIHRTNDFGSTWEELATLEEMYGEIFFQDASIGYLGGINCAYNPSIISKTINGGNTWNIIDTTEAHSITRFDFPDSSVGYFSGEFIWGKNDLPWGLVEMSEDNGNSWDEIFYTYDYMIHSLDFVSIDSGYIVGERVFGTPKPLIIRTFDVEVSENEIEYSDNQDLSISPNPFYKSTFINYEVTNPGNVELVIFDIYNTEIEKFDLGFQEETKGYLELTLNQKPSGTYFCTLFLDGIPQRTKKIIKVE